MRALLDDADAESEEDLPQVAASSHTAILSKDYVGCVQPVMSQVITVCVERTTFFHLPRVLKNVKSQDTKQLHLTG